MEKGPQQPLTATYTASIMSGVTGGNDDDPRYKCCCGAMHVRTGAMVLAIVELSFALLSISGAVSGGGDGYKSIYQGGSFLNDAAVVIVCSLMIYGLWSTKRYMLIPHMIFQAMAIFVCFIMAVLFLIGASVVAALSNSSPVYPDYPYPHHPQLQEKQPHRAAVDLGMSAIVLGIGAVILTLVAILELWFFLVVLGAFRYVRDKEISGLQGNPMVRCDGGSA